MKATKLTALALALGTAVLAHTPNAAAGFFGGKIANTEIGLDNNATKNPIVQPQDPALAGGGRDQTMQFGDVLYGSRRADLLIGRLGTDVLLGNNGNDVLLGGTEHFNPANRDRAFGGKGRDVFVWAPGDGSDLFDGGRGEDAVVFGLVGEEENGETVFRVSTDRQAGKVVIDPATRLPLVDVTNSPGFCEVIDRYTSTEAEEALDELDLDHLVRFSIRGVRNAFEAGQQNTDNGLRVTLHLKDVEVLVCTDRFGGAIEILDLTVSPPEPLELDELSRPLRKRLEAMVF